MVRKSNWGFLLFLFLTTPVYAQDGSDLLQTPVHPAPNAAALAKYADVPVSYYTGTPQISIPLYNVQQGPLSVPISLSYHASGIKVEDVASWVGLGWALNAGGTITRSIRGLADEQNYGFLSVGYKIDDGTSVYDGNYLFQATQGKIDTESDVYYFNMPAGSGKFNLTYNKEIVLQDYRPITIEPPFGTTNPYWRILVEDGSQYFFGEVNSEGILSGGVDISSTSTESGGIPESISSWHLQSVVSPDRTDTIFFYYDNMEGLDYFNYTPEFLTMLHPDETSFTVTGTGTITYTTEFCLGTPKYQIRGTNDFHCDQKLISKIKFKNGYVEFIPSSTFRPDLAGGHSLSQLNIRNNKGDLIKYFTFNYGDFDPQNSRLKLLSVVEHGADGSSLPPHSFTYNEEYKMPGRESFTQDHWGFYNSNPVNKLIPKNITKLDGTYLYYADGGSREPDPQKTLTYTLNGITYPTGGSTQFEFEAHDNSKVGHFQAKEYYYDMYSAVCNSLQSQSPDNTVQFTLAQQSSVEVITNCACKGGTETADASATLAKVGDPNPIAGGGCGGSTTVNNNSGSYYYVLDSGTYILSASAIYLTSTTNSRAAITVNIPRLRYVSDSTSQYVGGVRIKSIRTYGVNNALVNTKKFEYKYLNNGASTSSGVLINTPIYYFISTVSQNGEDVGGVLVSANCTQDNAISVAKNSLGEGTHIGYKEVKVIYGENGENGYSIYKYIAADTESDTGGNVFPFAPADSRDNRRGRITQQLDFNSNGDTLRYSTHSYFRDPTNYLKLSNNIKVGRVKPSIPDNILATDFKFSRYAAQQEWSYTSVTTDRSYNGNQKLVSTTNYYYARPQNHSFLTSQQTSLSDGSTVVKQFKYPQDYTIGGTGLNNINALVNAHIYNLPIEEQTWKTINGVNKLVSGKITDYDPQYFHPTKIWLLENANSLTSLNNETVTNGKYTNLLSDLSLYVPRAQFSYQNARLVSQSRTADVSHSFVWGHKSTFPIAEVTNADASGIAYTSFETDSDGNWTIPVARNSVDYFTGIQSYSFIAGAISKSGLIATQSYKVSCWVKNGGSVLVNGVSMTSGASRNGWTYYEKVFSGVTSVSISGVGSIDELRLYPSNALMTSYTYDPMLGETSMTDPNNVTTYYEYDSFGRLSVVRDQYRNILKENEYHYYQNNGQN